MHFRQELSYTSKDYFNYSLLVDYENTTLGSLQTVPHADCLDKGSMRVTEQGIRKALPCLERGVGFGRVCRQAIYGIPSHCQRRIVVPEQTSLSGTWQILVQKRMELVIEPQIHADTQWRQGWNNYLHPGVDAFGYVKRITPF